MNWIKINNIRWKNIENILFVIAIFLLLALGIEMADSTCKCTTPQSYKIFS